MINIRSAFAEQVLQSAHSSKMCVGGKIPTLMLFLLGLSFATLRSKMPCMCGGRLLVQQLAINMAAPHLRPARIWQVEQPATGWRSTHLRAGSSAPHAGVASSSLDANKVSSRYNTPEHRRLRLAVVGDCHGEYNEHDSAALISLAPDAALFVGDFSNEETTIPRILAGLADVIPIATIFGNHDAQKLRRFFLRAKNKKKQSWTWKTKRASTDHADGVAPGARPRLGGSEEFNVVREQHELLARSNVAWGRIDFASIPLSVVGGRPFSNGGDGMDYNSDIYRELWGVNSVEHSAKLIAEKLSSAPGSSATVLLAHQGPRGLGNLSHDICGKDWGDPRDWGDEDLALALSLCSGSCSVPLVVFGHMHDKLHDGGQRSMIRTTKDGQLCVNAARVPRWRKRDGVVERVFTMVDLVASGDEWSVGGVELLWVRPSGEITERQTLWPERKS